MLTTYEVAIYAAAVAVLLPLAGYSLITGSRAPESGWLARYYRAEKHLTLAGNLFLLAVCANAGTRLAVHFGYLDAARSDYIVLPAALVFGASLAAYLAMWVRAVLKVRRAGGAPT